MLHRVTYRSITMIMIARCARYTIDSNKIARHTIESNKIAGRGCAALQSLIDLHRSWSDHFIFYLYPTLHTSDHSPFIFWSIFMIDQSWSHWSLIRSIHLIIFIIYIYNPTYTSLHTLSLYLQITNWLINDRIKTTCKS